MTDSYPPKFTITPEGVANFFLMTYCKNAGVEASTALVGVFKLFYEQGYSDGLKKTADNS
jgi:hypothetical protein